MSASLLGQGGPEALSGKLRGQIDPSAKFGDPTANGPKAGQAPLRGKPQQQGLNCAGFSPTLTVVHRAPWDQLSRMGVCTDGPFLSDTSHPSVQGELFHLSVLLPACGFSGPEGGF